MNNEEARDDLSNIELLKKNLDLWKEEEGGEDNAIEDLKAITLPCLKIELYVRLHNYLII